MKNKKLIALAAAGVLALTAIAGGTIAYFTDTDGATNVITMGKVDIDFDEPGWENPDDVKPGDKYMKDPQITVVDGSEDAYIRAKVTISLTDLEGNPVIDPDTKLPIQPTAAELFEINDGWNPTPDADGYYYYNTSLAGPATVNLFKIKTDENGVEYTVQIPSSWGNKYADTKLIIDIQAEGIQADNFEPQMSGNNIVGWNGVTAETYPGN